MNNGSSPPSFHDRRNLFEQSSYVVLLFLPDLVKLLAAVVCFYRTVIRAGRNVGLARSRFRKYYFLTERRFSIMALIFLQSSLLTPERNFVPIHFYGPLRSSLYAVYHLLIVAFVYPYFVLLRRNNITSLSDYVGLRYDSVVLGKVFKFTTTIYVVLYVSRYLVRYQPTELLALFPPLSCIYTIHLILAIVITGFGGYGIAMLTIVMDKVIRIVGFVSVIVFFYVSNVSAGQHDNQQQQQLHDHQRQQQRHQYSLQGQMDSGEYDRFDIENCRYDWTIRNFLFQLQLPFVLDIGLQSYWAFPSQTRAKWCLLPAECLYIIEIVVTIYGSTVLTAYMKLCHNSLPTMLATRQWQEQESVNFAMTSIVMIVLLSHSGMFSVHIIDLSSQLFGFLQKKPHMAHPFKSPTDIFTFGLYTCLLVGFMILLSRLFGVQISDKWALLLEQLYGFTLLPVMSMLVILGPVLPYLTAKSVYFAAGLSSIASVIISCLFITGRVLPPLTVNHYGLRRMFYCGDNRTTMGSVIVNNLNALCNNSRSDMKCQTPTSASCFEAHWIQYHGLLVIFFFTFFACLLSHYVHVAPHMNDDLYFSMALKFWLQRKRITSSTTQLTKMLNTAKYNPLRNHETNFD